jgi:TonB family protein
MHRLRLISLAFIFLLSREALASSLRIAAEHETIANRGKNLPPLLKTTYRELVTDFDYPHEAAVEKRSGTTSYQLLVTRWGSVSDCTITTSSGHKDLDDALCFYASTRQSFLPATNADGKAIASQYYSKHIWTIPEWALLSEEQLCAKFNFVDTEYCKKFKFSKPNLPASPKPPEVSVTQQPRPINSGYLEWSFFVTKDGNIKDCLSKTEGLEQMSSPEDVCAKMNQKYKPSKDTNGNAVEHKVEFRMSVSKWPVDKSTEPN